MLRTCVEVKPKVDLEAISAAVEETSQNVAHVAFGWLGTTGDQKRDALALLTGKQWENGRTLKVFFEPTAAGVADRCKPYFMAWTEFANINFDFVSDRAAAEVRVGFNLGEGSWSYLGTDCLTTPKNEVTMNLGWLTPGEDEQEYKRVVLHEVGHSLGAIHEHQNPSGGIPWDRDAVYRYYSGPPNNWDKATIDHNIFERYSESQTNFTGFDRLSIMAYPVPNEMTLGDYYVPFNNQLSEQDKAFIRWCYPKGQQPPLPPKLPEITTARFAAHGVTERSLVTKRRKPWAIAEPAS